VSVLKSISRVMGVGSAQKLALSLWRLHDNERQAAGPTALYLPGRKKSPCFLKEADREQAIGEHWGGFRMRKSAVPKSILVGGTTRR